MGHVSQKQMDTLLGRYKRGKYFQGMLEKAVRKYSTSAKSVKQAIALKYSNVLSMRKLSLFCKT